jgi:hypothetical protein
MKLENLEDMLEVLSPEEAEKLNGGKSKFKFSFSGPGFFPFPYPYPFPYPFPGYPYH